MQLQVLPALQILALPDGVYGLVGTVVAAVVLAKLSKRPNLDEIPTVGCSTWLGSWWASIKYLTKAADVIRQGYEKHKGTPFKVANLYRWTVVVSGLQFVEEVRKASDDELSLLEASNDNLKVAYTLGHDVHYNPYTIPIIRSQLTRNIGILYPDICDEIVTAFEETLDLRGNDWKSVPALQTVQEVVCRTSNRVFVGLPLCRNADWIDLNVQFTLDVNDFLSWLMDHPEASESSVKDLTLRILAVNFAAIHSFTQALYNLAANPQYIEPLREEVESIVEKDGWSQRALVKMRKIDSFLKESQRIEGIDCGNFASYSYTAKLTTDPDSGYGKEGHERLHVLGWDCIAERDIGHHPHPGYPP
ncbi:cytochrome P450 [Paxillus ammoniavirescens]|nr:cytochrome P450 [Paxillus ammoniavirescens]